MFRSRSLESCLRSKDSRAVWRGAVGKGLQGTSLAAYPTSCPVLRGLVSGNTHRLPGGSPPAFGARLFLRGKKSPLSGVRSVN